MNIAQQLNATFRNKDKLVPQVERYLLKRPVDTSRRVDCIHPSEISHEHWCPRSTYYRIIGAHQEPIPSNLFQEIVFETGHDAHAKWQRWFREMGVLKGKWECLQCGYNWTAVSPESCPRCAGMGRMIVYKEVPVSCDEYLIAGSSDGEHVERNSLLEFKTVGTGTLRFENPKLLEKHGSNYQALWSSIRRPFPSHLRQGMIYLLCRPDIESIIFIYEPKFISAQPKEFEVRFNKEIIEEVLEKCLIIKKGIEINRKPKRPIWATQTNSTCQKCPFKSTCWGTSDSRSNSTNIKTANSSSKRIAKTRTSTRKTPIV